MLLGAGTTQTFYNPRLSREERSHAFCDEMQIHSAPAVPVRRTMLCTAVADGILVSRKAVLVDPNAAPLFTLSSFSLTIGIIDVYQYFQVIDVYDYF